MAAVAMHEDAGRGVDGCHKAKSCYQETVFFNRSDACSAVLRGLAP